MFSSRPPPTEADATAEISVLGGRRRRRPRHTAKKADRLPDSVVVASWTTHAAAVAASRATLDAPDPAAAMQTDRAVLSAVWGRRREALLGGDGGAALLSAMTKEEAQALLGTASANGDVAGMERAVAAGADVRAAVYYDYYVSMAPTTTAAHVAALDNNVAGLRFLVGACEVDPNAVANTHDGSTPIHVACWAGNSDAVTVLLALGADPTIADKNGRTPCMDAAAVAAAVREDGAGSLPCLRALVAGGPGGALAGDAVNAVNKSYGMTALDIALTTGGLNTNSTEFVAVLRKLGGKRAQDL